MDYTKTLADLKEASLFDLYRLSAAIRNELENPVRIQALRRVFKEGDSVSYFDEKCNVLQSAIVLQKNQKYVLVKNASDQKIWKISYYLLNLSGIDTDIHANSQEKLSKNHCAANTGHDLGFIGFRFSRPYSREIIANFDRNFRWKTTCQYATHPSILSTWFSLFLFRRWFSSFTTAHRGCNGKAF